MKQIHREEREHEEKRHFMFLTILWFQFEYILAFFLLFLAVDVNRSLLIATTLENKLTRI